MALGGLAVLGAACAVGRARVLREERERDLAPDQVARRVGLGGPLWSGRFGPDRA